MLLSMFLYLQLYFGNFIFTIGNFYLVNSFQHGEGNAHFLSPTISFLMEFFHCFYFYKAFLKRFFSSFW